MGIYKNLSTLSIVLILLVNIAIATIARVSYVKDLQGKYLDGYDPYLFYYQAKIIVKDGELPERDNMRYTPMGVESNRRTTLNSYCIAYFYKVIRIFMPSITLEQAAIAYPVFCFALALIAYTLLIIKLFSRAIGLLAATVLATIPALVPKTMAGFADRDALCLLEMFLAFYLYICATQTKNAKRQLSLSLGSGVVTGILALTWPGVGIVMSIVVAHNLLNLTLGKYDKQDLCSYMSWYLPAMFMAIVLTRVYVDVLQPHVILAVFVPTAFLGISVTTIVIRGRDGLKRRLSLSNRVPVGVSVTVLTLFMLVILIGVVSGPAAVAGSMRRAGRIFLQPILCGTPLAMTVGELARTTVPFWWHSYKGFLFLFVAGATVLVWELAGEYKVPREPLTLSFVIMLNATIISSMSEEPPLDGHTKISNVIYIIPILTFLGLACILCFRQYRCQGDKENSSNNLVFIMVWFTLLLFCTRAAVRFGVLFAPAAVALGSYVVVRFLQVLTKGDTKLAERLALYVIMSIICWETLAFGNVLSFALSTISFLKISISLSKYIDISLTLGLTILLIWLAIKPFFSGERLGYIRVGLFLAPMYILAVIAMGCIFTIHKPSPPSKEWQEVFNWIRKNTPESAVIAANWHHGNRILALTNRATIVDNEQIPYQIYLQERHLFGAQSAEEALEYLLTRKATHWLIGRMDIDGICSGGYTNGRKPLIHRLHADGSGLHFFAESGIPVEKVDLIPDVSGKLTSANIGLKDRTLELRPVPAPFAEEVYLLDDDSLKGYIALIPMRTPHERMENEKRKKWNILYLDETAESNLAIRLHFLGEKSPYFHLVYPADSEATQDGQIIDGIKIWEVNYPGGITENPDYLLLNDKFYYWSED